MSSLILKIMNLCHLFPCTLTYVDLGVNLYYNGKLKCAIDSIANQATRFVFGLRKAYEYDNLWILKLSNNYFILLLPLSYYIDVKYGDLKI